jgi:glycosyltransferase involved in cell wall biosynthesis
VQRSRTSVQESRWAPTAQTTLGDVDPANGAYAPDPNRPGAGLTACFFCRTADRSLFERVDFYARDLKILTDLGFRVHIATDVRSLVRADLYFVWWWTWAFFPVAFAKVLRRPVIVTGTFDLWNFDSRRPLHRLLHRYALKQADVNVFVSELEHAGVPRVFRAANPQYSPLGVDTSLLRPGTGDRERFILTIAGSGMDQGNSDRKCIAELIQSVPLVRRTHPDVRFVIVGKKGSDFPRLFDLAKSVGAAEYIDFRGIVTVEEKLSLLQRCCLYVQPSRHEGFGVSILEAMSCGAPVITSAAGAVPEVGGDAVEYTPSIAPQQIADTISELLDDDARRADLGRRARERAQGLFAAERRLADMRRIVREVLPRRTRTAKV